MKENSIEKDILNIEKYVELVIDQNYCDCNELNVICTGNYGDGSKNVAYSMQHILSDYKRVLKENEELKNKLLDTLEGQKVIKEETPQYIKENYIPVQKVKDKIEELYQQDRRWSEELSEPDSNFKYIDKNLKRIKNQIDILQELLERRK